MTDLVKQAREQAERRSLSGATRFLLTSLAKALEAAEKELEAYEQMRKFMMFPDAKSMQGYCLLIQQKADRLASTEKETKRMKKHSENLRLDYLDEHVHAEKAEALTRENYCKFMRQKERAEKAEVEAKDKEKYTIELYSRAKNAEAERDAAIKDIKCKDHCDVCKFSHEGAEDCDTYDFECQKCQSTKCVCRACKNEDKWEWRGARKDGENG